MYAEILLNVKVGVYIDCFVTERADIDLFILFFVGSTTVGFNRGMVSTVDLAAILAFHREPIFLLTNLESAVLTYILIEHLK